MDADDRIRWRFAFFVLAITVGWAIFAVWMTWRAICMATTMDILAAAGTNVLLGAMINWSGNVVQFYFRRKKPE